MVDHYKYKNGLARADAKSPWHFLFRYKGTKYQGSTGQLNHEAAVKWLRQYRANLANHEVGLADAPTVEMAYKSWLATRKGKVSAAHLKRARQAMELHVLPTVGQLRVDMLTNEVVEGLLTTYLTRPSQRTPKKPVTDKDGKVTTPPLPTRTQFGANVLVSYLRMVVKPLTKGLRPFLKGMPFDLKPMRPQEPVRAYVTEAQVPAFLREIDRTKNTHVSVAVRLMLYLGLREDEALSLRWAWIGGDIETISTGKAKGKKARVLPIPKELREMIRQLPSTSVFLLPAEPKEGKDGVVRIGPHHAQFTTKAVKRAGEKIKVAGLSPHRLRNTAATLMARAGVPTTTIQKQLGHARIETTQKYVQVGLDDLKTAMEKTWGKVSV